MEHIGKGTFGDIFMAQDQKENVVVAVKKVKTNNAKQLGLDPRDLMQKIKMEREVVMSCSHKKIIKLLDNYQNKTKFTKELYLVMEFCAGGNLSAYMECEGPLSEENSRHFATQLKEAILYLNMFEVTHRDLRPTHILLTEYSENADLKIIGFGASKFKQYDGSGATAYKTGGGKNHYVAPELSDKDGVATFNTYGSNGTLCMVYIAHRRFIFWVSARSVDLWSLGVIIYEMMTNGLPYGNEKSSKLEQVIEENVKKVVCHENAKKLMRGLLKVNPKNRKWNALRDSEWLSDRTSNTMSSDEDEKGQDSSNQQKELHRVHKRPRNDSE